MSDSPAHFIHIGPRGTFGASGQFSSTPASIDALFSGMTQAGCKQILIYFHGGLVDEQSALETARSLSAPFSQSGAQPVFFIWETGPWETIRQNVPKILSSKLVKELLLFILAQVARRWGIEIPGKGPGETMTAEEVEAELAREVPFENRGSAGGARGGAEILSEADLQAAQAEMETELAFLMQERYAQLEQGMLEAADDALLSEEIRAKGVESGAKGVELVWLAQVAARAAYQVLRRLATQQDHGLYPTAVEELLRATSLDGVGKFLWEAMKEKAAQMWLPNPQVLPANFSQAHAGSYFLARLAEYALATPGFQADLAGHSAGSIVICELLRAAAQRHPALKFGRIALLAPAARVDLFAREIASHPERFEQLRIYTMREALELKDAIAGKIYPLSLLYFVSGVLEDPDPTPICGLERSLSGLGPNGQGDALLAHDFVYAPGQNRLALSISPAGAPPGLRTNAEHHGEFDNLTMRSGQPGETIQSLLVYFQR